MTERTESTSKYNPNTNYATSYAFKDGDQSFSYPTSQERDIAMRAYFKTKTEAQAAAALKRVTDTIQAITDMDFKAKADTIADSVSDIMGNIGSILVDLSKDNTLKARISEEISSAGPVINAYASMFQGVFQAMAVGMPKFEAELEKQQESSKPFSSEDIGLITKAKLIFPVLRIKEAGKHLASTLNIPLS